MPISTQIPEIRTARDQGLAYFQLIITNWGDKGAAADTSESAFVSDIPVRWFAMDPGSDYDAVLVRYDNRPPAPIATTADQRGIQQANELIMSVSHPLTDKVTAQFSLRPILTSLFTDTYRTMGGATATFGSALTQGGQGGTINSTGIWMQPQLRVLMGFEDPPQQFPKRAHKLYRFTRSTSGDGTEELLLVVPVFGRNRARVTLFAANGTTYSVRLTAVGGTVYQPAIGAQQPFLQEFSLGAPSTGTPLVGPAEVTFQLQLDNVVANYLLLKATRTAGTNMDIQVEVAD